MNSKIFSINLSENKILNKIPLSTNGLFGLVFKLPKGPVVRNSGHIVPNLIISDTNFFKGINIAF